MFLAQEALLRSCGAFCSCLRSFKNKFPTEFVLAELPAIEKASLGKPGTLP